MPDINFVQITTSLVATPAPPLDYLNVCGIPATAPPFAPTAAKAYSSGTEMLDDGFLSTDVAYLAAVQVFGQDDTTSPTLIVIIAKGSYTAQVQDLQITNNTDGTYEVYTAVLGGGALVLVSTFAAVAQTITQIRNGLLAAWTGTDQTPASQSTDKIRVTAATAGAPFLLSGDGPAVNSFAASTNVTPSVGPYDEMDTAFATSPFWAVIPDPAEAPGLMLEWSRWAEASKEANSRRRNCAIIQVVDADIADAVSPNTAETYEALVRTRSFLVVHANTVDQMSATDFGKYGGLPPGSRAWHFRQVNGTSETTNITYSKTQGDNLIAAKVSWVERDTPTTSSPVKIQWDQGSGGFFIVQKHAEDRWWLTTQAAMVAEKESRAGLNIDDASIARLVAAIDQVNIALAADGVIDLARTTVTAAAAASVDPSKAALGLYTAPDGGITVDTVLIPKLRALSVSGVFATS